MFKSKYKYLLVTVAISISALAFSIDVKAETTVTATYGDDKNPGPSSAVTEVYSINNTLTNCYYKPLLADVPLLEERVLEKGFVNAYTGYFDLNHTEPYKPTDSTSRALEILGYDYLLSNESYMTGGNYSVSKTNASYITMNTAVMDLYKAIGQPIYSVSLVYEPTTIAYMNQSPAIKGLPGYVDGINSSRGKTKVFVTRTNPNLYKDKAMKDLHISSSVFNSGSSLTGGEFIVLAAKMMDYYGEPVLSDTEMNAMLQVYGATTPTYLTPAETSAYLYLKARGILNDDTVDYDKAITLKQMLDILMCIADKDSRTDFKELQVTMDIGDELKSKGYFPKSVSIVDGDAAVQIKEKYDYSKVTSYDYFIEVTSITKFRDKEGTDVGSIFIPSIPGDTKSDALGGVYYYGIETAENGKKYYHLSIPLTDGNTTYMQKVLAATGTTNWFQVNSSDDTDLPTYMWLEQGGGTYTVESVDKANGVILKRTPFVDGTFKSAASAERRQASVTANNKQVSFFDKVCNVFSDTAAFLFNPMVVHATSNTDVMGQSTSGVMVEMDLYNASNIISYATDISGMTVSVNNDVMVVKLPVSRREYFLSSIKRDVTKSENKMYSAIATMYGDNILITYSDLASMGIFYTVDGKLPTTESSNSNILVLNSKYGQVKLNNETHEIVVGSTLYKVVDENTVLFQYKLNEDGSGDLLIDFRAAYGWTTNIVDLVVTGTSDSYTVNVQTISDTKALGNKLNDVEVRLPKSFRSGVTYESMTVIPKGMVVDSISPKALTTTTYTLANWLIYEGVDADGLERDYCFVFYPKDAVSSSFVDDMDMMSNIVGYKVIADDWVCKVFTLDRKLNATVGQFTYTEDFGYVYNLPSWEEFDMSKYLSGVYMLPISADMKDEMCIINANVNVFANCSYGSRPASSTRVIDIKGNDIPTTSNSTYSTDVQVKAAPAAVSAFYGGVARRAYTVSTVKADNSNAANTCFYYGTMPVEVTKDSVKGYHAKAVFTGANNGWNLLWSLTEDQVFYLSNTWVVGSANNIQSFAQRYVMFDDVLTSSITDESVSDNQEKAPEIIDGERKDDYNGFSDFWNKHLLDTLDFIVTWVLYFCVTVFPLIGIGALTVIFGLVMIGDNRLLKLFCRKFFDPVKFLSFGNITLEELTPMRALFCLIIGYIAFALILDGNILRVLAWVGSLFSALWQLFRQL